MHVEACRSEAKRLRIRDMRISHPLQIATANSHLHITPICRICLFTPQPLRAVGVLFSPIVSGLGGWVGVWEKACPGCISETVRCRKLILGRDIG